MKILIAREVTRCSNCLEEFKGVGCTCCDDCEHVVMSIVAESRIP